MSSKSISCSSASLQIFLICGSYLFTTRFIFWNSPDVQVYEVHLTGMDWKGATNMFPQVGQMYVQDFPTFSGIRIFIYYNIMSLFCFINNFIAYSWFHDNTVGTTLNNVDCADDGQACIMFEVFQTETSAVAHGSFDLLQCNIQILL